MAENGRETDNMIEQSNNAFEERQHQNK